MTVLTEQNDIISTVKAKEIDELQRNYKLQIVWKQVVRMLYVHLGALYGAYLFCFQCSWKTCIFTYISLFMAGQGITAGAHRLWTHRSYKAKLPLRIILMIFQSMAFQTHIFEWARNHRVHHKFTDTDADPHNAKRGFFFSHVGWVLVRKHPEVLIKGKTIDISDLETDPVVKFQKKYYIVLAITTSWLIPAFVPFYFWNENFWVSYFTAGLLKQCVALHFTFLVNSVAHRWGTKPYDIFIGPVESKFVSFLTYGEGWHNYHHVFPWDYKTGELSSYRKNPTTLFIDLFANIGWAYDLKVTSSEMIKKRASRTGDGSRRFSSSAGTMLKPYDENEKNVWGWGDTDMELEDIGYVKTYNQTEILN